MRNLLLLLVVCLTGCASQLTLISPPIHDDLRVRCGNTIAQPITTGDQYDLARALVEAAKYGKDCKARMDALVNAVEVRQEILESVKKQIEDSKR